MEKEELFVNSVPVDNAAAAGGDDAAPMEDSTPAPQAAGEKEPGLADRATGRDLSRDAAFARMRREAEGARRELKELKERLYGDKGEAAALKAPLAEGNGPLPGPEGGYYVDDSTAKADNGERGAQSAVNGGGDISALKTEGGARIAALLEENRSLKAREHRRIFDDDLKAVRDVWPDFSGEDVFSLGQDFMLLRAAGVDAVTAVEAVRLSAARREGTPPPTTGPVKGQGGAQGEFFSQGELDALTPRDLNDPRILKKAIRSLSKI